MILNKTLAKLAYMKTAIKNRKDHISFKDYDKINAILDDCHAKIAHIIYKDGGEK